MDSSQIALALVTSVPTIDQTRQLLGEKGFKDVLTREHSSAFAKQCTFDGAVAAVFQPMRHCYRPTE